MPTGKYRFMPEEYANLLGGGVSKELTRTTQFSGFAELLWKELIATDAERYGDQQCELIAQRAYDLVKHTIGNIEHIDLDRLRTDEHVQRIPDMTEWPEEENIAASVERFLLDPNHTKEEKQERVRQVIQSLMEEGNVMMDIPLIHEWLKKK